MADTDNGGGDSESGPGFRVLARSPEPDGDLVQRSQTPTAAALAGWRGESATRGAVMEPAALGTMAVGILAPYLAEAGSVAAKELGKGAAAQVEGLIEAIRRKFGADQDAYAGQTLARLEEQPATESRKRALADVLAEKAEADDGFKDELERIVAAARSSPGTMQFLTQVYGGKVDEILNVGSVQTLNIGRREESSRDDGAGRSGQP